MRATPEVRTGAAPFVGSWRFYAGWRALPVIAFAFAAVALAPKLAQTLPWRRLLVAAGLLTIAWAVALNFVDGPGALTGPLESRYEYLRHVPNVKSPGDYLRHFVERLPREATHVKSHPPGMVLVLWALDRAGLGGAGPAAALILAAAGAATVAVLTALRDVAGEQAARTAAPFVALLPAATWMATSPDAFFAGVTAAGIAAVVVATSRAGRRSDAWAAAGGVTLGAGAFLSYGMVALLVIPFAAGVLRRRWRPLLVAGGAVALVVAAFAGAGFWWLDGLAATHDRYRTGVASVRPYGYYLVGNLAVLAVAVGPAVAVAVSRLREHSGLLLCGSALAVLAVIDVSALSKGEVERIWLPFYVWVASAAGAFAGAGPAGSFAGAGPAGSFAGAGPAGSFAGAGPAGAQRWLALNVASGVVLQLTLASPW